MIKHLIPFLYSIFLTHQLSFSQNQSQNIDLVGQLTYDVFLADIWGYADEVGNEYALVGTTHGLSIVSLEDPTQPQELFFLEGAVSDWRDIKTFKGYAYVSNEEADGIMIVDLRQLPTSAPFKNEVIAGVRTIHNLWIDQETSFLYMVGINNFSGGMVICDLNDDPWNPRIIGVYDQNYVHDVYVRNNIAYAAEMDVRRLTTIDVAEPANPQVLGSTTYRNAFTHNTWLNDAGNVCFTTDETRDVYVRSWDVSEPTSIRPLDSIRSQLSNGTAIPHNVHVINDFLVTSYYTDGIHITDASQASELVEIGYYDTSLRTGAQAEGCWGAYPFLPSGLILATDIEEGLFVLKADYQRAAFLSGIITDASNGQLLDSVYLEILDKEKNTFSKEAGDYILGINDEGSYEIQVVKFGYLPDTILVNLTRGEVLERNIQLEPAALRSFQVKLIDKTSRSPIEDGQILFTPSHTDITFLFQSELDGNASIESFTEGLYEIFAGKWGYKTQKILLNLNTNTDNLTIELEAGYQDDFVFDFGWTESGTASAGKWERGKPKETKFQATPINPGFDVRNDLGDKAYVTGNQGIDFFDDDVDDGFTTLSSPFFNLDIYEDPIISFKWWGINYIAFSQGGQAGNGYLKVELSNGEETVEITRFESAFNSDIWKAFSFKVANFITPTNQMQIHFTSDDPEPGNIVEGGVDNFKVEGTLLTDIDERKVFTLFDAYPNPVINELHITYQQKRPERLSFSIYDLHGKFLTQYSKNAQISSAFSIPFPYPSGIYFLQIRKDNRLIATRKLVKY